MSPPLIRPPYLPKNCGHIREVAFGKREKLIHFIAVAPKICGHIREGGFCWEWPVKEGLLYIHHISRPLFLSFFFVVLFLLTYGTLWEWKFLKWYCSHSFHLNSCSHSFHTENIHSSGYFLISAKFKKMYNTWNFLYESQLESPKIWDLLKTADHIVKRMKLDK